MKTEAESVCCRDLEKVTLRMDEQTPIPSCVTLHPGFASVCLAPENLRALYYSYAEDYQHMDGIPNNKLV
jgi:hypothetical protein